MAKAEEFVQAILQEIIVQESEQQIAAPDAQDTIEAMNDYMTAQDALGVSLGYTLIDDLGDDVTIPPGAFMGVKKNVAIYMASQFGATVKQATVEMAKVGYKAMLKLTRGQQQMVHPPTFPLGSGNEWPESGQRFYSDEDAEMLTEQDGSILLEDDSN